MQSSILIRHLLSQSFANATFSFLEKASHAKNFYQKSKCCCRAVIFGEINFQKSFLKAPSAVILSEALPRFRFAILLAQNFDSVLRTTLKMTAAGRSRNAKRKRQSRLDLAAVKAKS